MYKKYKKVESVSDFLARGGKIKILPSQGKPEKETTVNSTTTGPVTILSFDEADLFYGEPQLNKVPKSSKSQPEFDFNALPASLREKLLRKIEDEVDNEED